MLCYSFLCTMHKGKKGYVLNKRYIPFKNINTSHRIYRSPIALEGRTRLDTNNDAKVNGDSIAGDSKWSTDTKKRESTREECVLASCSLHL